MIKKGTVVTCENGHQVSTIAYDIMPFELLGGHSFKDWKQAKPNPYADINTIKCSICGAKWIKFAHDNRVLVHTADGWISVEQKSDHDKG